MNNTGTIDLECDETDEPAMALHLALTLLSGLKSGDIGPGELEQIEEIKLMLESLKGVIH